MCILLSVLSLMVFSRTASAQFGGGSSIFKQEAFSQSYNDDQASPSDTTDMIFSFKKYFGGLGHKNTYEVEKMALGSAIVVGGMQIYNNQYWKLPIVYGGIAAGVGVGLAYSSKYKKSGLQQDKLTSTLAFVGAGAFYWGAMLDGVISYKPADYPSPGKAMMYSILCPGLGQIYNGEIWKLPIYWGGLATSYYFYSENRRNYERFRDIYNRATDPAGGYDGPITSDTALYYRNTYRRLRDYSMLAICAVYLLQVIDANVFAYMHNFEVDDNLTMNISPTIITPDNAYAGAFQQPAVGMSLGFNF